VHIRKASFSAFLEEDVEDMETSRGFLMLARDPTSPWQPVREWKPKIRAEEFSSAFAVPSRNNSIDPLFYTLHNIKTHNFFWAIRCLLAVTILHTKLRISLNRLKEKEKAEPSKQNDTPYIY
jgi:hypothetical protein